MRRARAASCCHSHHDKDLAQGLQAMLLQHGCRVYLDWQDTTMPPNPDRTTAAKIQDRIKKSDYFMFLATRHSVVSRWCPWEIGYADSVKGSV
jgi:disulfide oxidoreductase YuzD